MAEVVWATDSVAATVWPSFPKQEQAHASDWFGLSLAVEGAPGKPALCRGRAHADEVNLHTVVLEPNLGAVALTARLCVSGFLRGLGDGSSIMGPDYPSDATDAWFGVAYSSD
ncbi:hypothetical protein FOZ60_002452 [Perkinsus olseni]|uniref:Uncharacterized protein n=1 Tax=Perkinsus olseni TaxID=32597 RepID=A0A7J6NYV8_PEROL|nr:hypothetical protein FOZ60_002452 [Perkinsus olseni]